MSRILEEVGFVHLHVHSSFSLLEGALKIDELKKLATKDRMPALALTDTNNLFGALEFSEKLAGAGVQPIIGVELALDMGDVAPGRAGAVHTVYPSVVLLAATELGYENLMKLSSLAYLSPQIGEAPHVAFQTLADSSEGVIVLSGGSKGPVDRGAGRIG